MDTHERLIMMYKGLCQICPYEKNLIAKEAVESTIPLTLLLTNPMLYHRLLKQFYVFYSIFSQNTNDKYSEKTLKAMYNCVELRGYNQKMYYDYFYKHKKENYESFLKLLILLDKPDPCGLDFQRFIELPRIGLKTGALIHNHFIQYNALPVVDVHVVNGYNKLCSYVGLKKERNPNKLFHLFNELSNYCNFNLGYMICSKLYAYDRTYKEPPVHLKTYLEEKRL